MQDLTRYWWLVVARGVASIAIAVLAFAVPVGTMTALVMLMGAFALVNGVFVLATGLRARAWGQRRWPVLVQGGLGVGLGLIALAAPVAVAVAVLVLVAVWVIATGVLELLAAVQLRRVIHGEWVLAACGLLSVALGVFFIAQPGAGLVALVWVFGLYSLISGIALVWLGVRMRRAGRVVPAPY